MSASRRSSACDETQSQSSRAPAAASVLPCKLAPVVKLEPIANVNNSAAAPAATMTPVKQEPESAPAPASDMCGSAAEFQEPSAFALYQEAVDSDVSTFGDWLVLPHLALAEFLQLRGDYKAALDRWAHASTVLSKFVC